MSVRRIYQDVDDRNPGVGSTPPGASGETQGSGRSRSGTVRRAPLGVPDDFLTPRSVSRGDVGSADALERLANTPRPPRYYDGDELVPNRYPPATIIAIQDKLHGIGMLGSFRRGIWDLDTAKAYAELLSYANYRGLDADKALTELVESSMSAGTFGVGGRGHFDPITGEWVADVEGVNQRAPLVIRQSDPIELKRVFDAAVIETLGVGWDDQRINAMVQAYQTLEAQRQQIAYDMEVTGGTVLEIPSPESFAQDYTEKADPAGAEKTRALNTISETIPLLAQGAWGVG